MMENINSAADYANVVIEAILEAEQSAPDDEKMDSTLLKIHIQKISEFAEVTWMDYINGNRETYLFSDIEFIDLSKQAFEDYIQITLNKMSDDGLLQTGVDMEGNIVYSITDEGKNIINSI